MNKSTTMLLGCLGCIGLPVLGCGGLMLVGMFEEGVSKSQKASQERRAEAAARERAPGLAKEMEEFIAVGNWSEAGRVHAELMAADPLYPGLKEAWTQIEPGYRKVEVPKWIAEAQAVATAKEKCAEPKAISDVWKNLRKVKSTDSDFAKAKTAAGQLEKCRARAEREMDATMESIFLDQRKKVANEMEMKFLDEGINTRVTLQGAKKDQLVIKGALMGRVLGHKLTGGGAMYEGSLLYNLQEAGFKRVTFTDGFDESFYYTLEPDKASKGNQVLAELGLGKPLKLE